MRSPAPPRPEPRLLDAVPVTLARRARALPTRLEAGVLQVHSADGADDDPLLDEMRVLVGAVDVSAVHDPDVVPHLLAAYARHALPHALDDAVVLLDVLLDLAAGSGASDLHLESDPQGMRVRQRIDGHLHDVTRVPATTTPALIARTKVRAGLDVAERRLPQDGRLTHGLPDGGLDVRVATMPTRDGERIALRLLPTDRTRVALDGLGLPAPVVDALQRVVGTADGLVIVCGPTGSGKTTTLHALLTHLGDGRRNVMTLEDPVERAVPGTSQTQIDPAHGLSFATGLRHLLRHDPDVLMVGEVRDRDTAHLAVEAAQTGHLVLTSLHAVDAPAALTRLHELGIPTSLLADTVRLVVAQRLLALPCPDCARADGPSTVAPADCTGCGGTATRGRSAIAEALELDVTLRDLLRRGDAPGAHHAALAAAMGPRLRTLALERAARGRARLSDVVAMTPLATTPLTMTPSTRASAADHRRDPRPTPSLPSPSAP